MFKGKAVVFALTLLVATTAFAGEVDDCLTNLGVSCTGMKISICPAGDFEYIRNACGGAADYIYIEAKNSSGVAIQGIPWTDYWLNSCDATKLFCLCAQPIVADSLTGINGRTTFSGRIAAGGCSPTMGIWFAVQGKVIKTKPCPSTTPLCLAIVVKGPDLTGAGGNADCKVDLSDVIPFASTFNKNLGDASYNLCCDYNDDDKVNLSDFALLGGHYQHRCF